MLAVEVLGGLSFPDDGEVQRMALRCLQLYDKNPDSAGCMHAQSQRFLNPQWQGLRPNSDDFDPPLRSFVEGLACQELTLSELVLTPNPSPELQSLLTWLSGFRLATRLGLFWFSVQFSDQLVSYDDSIKMLKTQLKTQDTTQDSRFDLTRLDY